MDFNSGIRHLEQSLRLPLPGEPAQRLLAPFLRKRTDELKRINKNYRESSVLILLYAGNKNKLTTVFIERPIDNSIHSGQIAFPGGKSEPEDRSLSHTALRETEEEIGIPSSDITIMGRLTELFIPASNYLVHPFIGFMNTNPTFRIDPTEVNTVIPYAIDELLSLEIQSTTINTSYGKLDTPFLDINGHTLWGATAMMTSEFRSLF